MAMNERIEPGRSFAPRVSALQAGVFVLACFAAVGCGESDDAVAPPPDPPRATTISVSPTTASLAYVGETVAFRATVTDQYGGPFSGSVTWVSSAPQVFTVSTIGVVTAVANGSGTVTASVQGVSGSAAVLVEQLPTALAVVSGDDQNGRPGRPLSQPLTVLVADAGGAPVANVGVEFVPAKGSGQVSRPTAVTDATGEATTIWTLGDSFGTQTVAASIASGPSAILTATALRPEALVDSIVVVSGDGQTARVGTALREPIVLRVLDAQGLPVDSASILFDLPEGHGRIAPDSTTTDEAGLAATTWTLGGKKGLQLLTAAVPGHASVRLAATGLFGAGLELVSGNRQSADVDTELSEPVVLRVRDQMGQALEGVSVRFTPNRGHGRVSPDSVTSDSSGEAATTWTLGGTAGIQTLTAAVIGGEVSAAITARAKSGLGVCDRTPQIREAIMVRVGSSDCANVTEDRLRSVRWLDFRDAPTIASLYDDDFEGLHNLEWLNLERHEIRELPKGVFRGLPSLVSLLLDGNRIHELPAGVFAELKNLRVLWLGGNELTALPDQAFAGLANLEELLLSDNSLSTLDDPDVFSHLPALQKLHIRGNPVVNMVPRLFSKLTELRSLSLGDPDLRRIPQGVFAGLVHLVHLELEDTGLSEFPPGIFADLASLRALWLQGNNRLRRLDSSVFAGLSELESLFIHSAVTELPPDLLEGLANLRELTLGGHFTEVPEDLFTDVVGLERLWLGGQYGSRIPGIPNAIRHLSELKDLGVGRVGLGDLAPGAFADLANLERLRLSDVGGSGAPNGELSTGVFRGLSKLWELRLSSSPSLELSPGFLHGPFNLHRLELTGMGIARLPDKVLSATPNLKALHVWRSGVAELPPGVFSGLHGLEELWLQRNPGTPFPISLSMARTDTTDLAAPGPATVVIRVAEGAPFDMEITLSASGGTLSTVSVTIPTGATESAPITVTGSGQGSTTVEFGRMPELPDSLCPKGYPGRTPNDPCYTGIFVKKGDALQLFR